MPSSLSACCCEVARHTVSRHTWTRQLSPSQAWLRERRLLAASEELPESLENYKANPLFTELARALPFVEDFAHKKSSARHINLGELSAILEGEARRAYFKPSCPCQVACGALVKGRSASRPLCRMLKQSLDVALAFDVLRYQTSLH